MLIHPIETVHALIENSIETMHISNLHFETLALLKCLPLNSHLHLLLQTLSSVLQEFQFVCSIEKHSSTPHLFHSSAPKSPIG